MAIVDSNSIKLPQLNRIPTVIDLENLLAWLSQCQETYLLEHSLDSLKQVILPWLQGSSGEAYALGIRISPKMPDVRPIWTFYKGLEPEPVVEWAYSTHDVSLIHNMLLCFFPDEQLKHEPETAFVSPPTAESKKSTESERSPFLQGSIQALQLECVLQSLASSRITGKLVVTFENQTGYLYFEQGAPVHCTLNGEEGHDAILQLLSWQGGEFDVYSDEVADRQTITRRMESLLMEGAALRDYELFFENAGITEKTVLEKTDISGEAFVEGMKNAPPVDHHLLSAIVGQLDSPASLEEITARLGLNRASWMPALYGLVKAGALKVSSLQETARAAHQKLLQKQSRLVAEEGLLNSETGLYSAAAFKLFLQMELARCHAHRRCFSLLILDAAGEKQAKTLFPGQINYVQALELLIRPGDLICHMRDHKVAVLLPDTNRAGAEIIARRMQEQWTKQALRAGCKNPTVQVFLIAYPADGLNAEELLRAVEDNCLESCAEAPQF